MMAFYLPGLVSIKKAAAKGCPYVLLPKPESGSAFIT